MPKPGSRPADRCKSIGPAASRSPNLLTFWSPGLDPGHFESHQNSMKGAQTQVAQVRTGKLGEVGQHQAHRILVGLAFKVVKNPPKAADVT